ncbi:MAG: amino acid ABC transporter permease [Thermofilum sp.]
MIDFLTSYAGYIAEGVAVTLQITLMSYTLGFALGALLLAGGLSPLSLLTRMYIEPVRGTPLLVQIFIIYFGLPAIGIKLDAFTSAVLALGLNSAAYQAEILRSAVKAIPESQIHAAEVLGFSGAQTYRYVILPLALRSSIPALVNEFVTVLKESSLASVIGIVELTRRGEYVAAYTYRAFEAYLIVALIYFIACYTFSQFSRLLERKLRIPGYTGA